MTERDDRQDIADMLVRYATAIDRREWPLLRSVFADDCEVDYGEIGAWNGVEAVVGFMEQAHSMGGHTLRTLHRLSNIAITVDGDKAEARTYLDGLMMAADNTSGVNAIGYYDDEIVRTLDGWRVARRRLAIVRMTTIGTA